MFSTTTHTRTIYPYIREVTFLNEGRHYTYFRYCIVKSNRWKVKPHTGGLHKILRDAAIDMDKYLIRQGIAPVNILKQLK